MAHSSGKPKIFVAGHRGLVGSALVRSLRRAGYENLLLRTHSELDLTDRAAVADFFAANRPDWVFLAAAKVGGIYANNTYPADFIFENLKIQCNVIESARLNSAAKLMFLGSSCIYPKNSPQPIREEYLLTSELEPTNRPYALAKISGIEMCDACNRQYGTDFMAVMPCNLYGVNDNYHPENAHVIPMLMRRFHEAKLAGAATVGVWGTGSPLREFMNSDDLGDACVYLMERCHASDLGRFINIGCGVAGEVTIRELAELVRETVGFRGELVFDPSKPDGTMRKVMDVSRINALGWKAAIPLAAGLRTAYEDFLNQHEGKAK